MKKYHAVALTIPSWNGKPGLMTEGRDGVWYYGLSRSHFSGIEVDVLKDYGFIDENGFGDIELQFAKDFFSLEKGVRDSCGWLSPDGTFFPCESWAHDGTANLICKLEFGFVSDYGTADLEKKGWLRVCEKYVARAEKVTQRQVDTLFDLSQLTTDEKLKRNIEFTIKHSETVY